MTLQPMAVRLALLYEVPCPGRPCPFLLRVALRGAAMLFRALPGGGGMMQATFSE